MRLEVSTQTEISSLRKQSMMVLVILLQKACSAIEQSSLYSGWLFTKFFRVSSLTQLFILPLIMLWYRQNLLMFHPFSTPLRLSNFSTMLQDFPFFWMKESTRRMMLGTTFLFSSCCDFFDFLEMQSSGWQSSSLGTVFCLGAGAEGFLVSRQTTDSLYDSSQCLRRMVSAKVCFQHPEFSSSMLEITSGENSVFGRVQASPAGTQMVGYTKQNQITQFVPWRIDSIYLINIIVSNQFMAFEQQPSQLIFRQIEHTSANGLIFLLGALWPCLALSAGPFFRFLGCFCIIKKLVSLFLLSPFKSIGSQQLHKASLLTVADLSLLVISAIHAEKLASDPESIMICPFSIMNQGNIAIDILQHLPSCFHGQIHRSHGICDSDWSLYRKSREHSRLYSPSHFGQLESIGLISFRQGQRAWV